MKNFKNSRAVLVALLGLTLAGCNNQPAPATTTSAATTDATSSAADSSAAATTSEVTSHAETDVWVEADVKRTVIPEGGCFFDFCQPTVIFHNGTKGATDVTNYTLKTEYQITKVGDDSGKTYTAGEPLTPGSYQCRVRFLQGKYPKAYVNFSVESAEPVEGGEGLGYRTYTLDEMEGYTYKDFSKIDTLDGGSMPSLGNSKVLVIPVEFTNVKFDNPDTVEDEAELARRVMNEAFFADTEDTPWESLASYYRKASYGKLNITGKVTPVYTYNRSDADIRDSENGIATTIANAAVEYFKSTGEINAQEFDSDGDGYIDGVELIYVTTHGTPSSTQDEGANQIWWNYTTNCSAGANVKSPVAHRMFWSRYDYLTQNYYAGNEKGIMVDNKKVDPHTIIHETGHMMGAPDYYSYAHDEGPAGCVDMMDCNVGDHNAYTKMQYGWVAPKVIDGSSKNFTMTLNSFTETGEFVLLRNTLDNRWNETPFDEYLVLQYYTPTGLNEMDHLGYGEWLSAQSSTGGSVYGHSGTYAHPGLQVFHADGRVVAQKADYVAGKAGTKIWDWTDSPKKADTADATAGTWESAARRTLANTGNLVGRASQAPEDGKMALTDFRELSIITPSGVPSFKGSSYTNNMGNMANLFGMNGVPLDDDWMGDPTEQSADLKFGGTHYSAYTMRDLYPNIYDFNDGSHLNWTFEVVEQTASSIKIHFICTDAQ